MQKSMKILITGSSGFIGYHLAKKILSINDFIQIIGVDNMNNYYDIQLKKDRLKELENFSNFLFYKTDIKESADINRIFEEHKPNIVINLAAQAGVRYSITYPQAYIDSNLLGFYNILEACRKYPVEHLLFASSSSVYGNNKEIPFTTYQQTDQPLSLYAATKKSNELIAYSYSHLYGIPMTGLRLFTVYGPFGRPDMVYYSFTKDILQGNPIQVFNHGNMERDFTYIDDVVEGIISLLRKPPILNADRDENKHFLSESFVPYKIYNLGNNNPVRLDEFIKILEKLIGKEGEKIYLDMQPGDVNQTYADISELERYIGFKPRTSIEEGLKNFVQWYKNYYQTEE